MKRFEEMLKSGEFPLVMSLPANDINLARAAWQNGADAVKVHINVQHQASGTHFVSFDEEKEVLLQMLEEAKGPMGIVVGGDIDSADKDIEKVVEAGFDFISLYGTNASAKIMEETRVSKMFAPKNDWTYEEIKLMKDFGADILEASIFQQEGSQYRPNQKEWIDYKIISDICGLPVLVPTQHKILPEEVRMLKKAGVSAVMIGAVVTGKSADSIGEAVAAFRKEIDLMKAGR